MKPGKITYRVAGTRSGLDTLIVSHNGKEMPLHSKVDPERERETFARAFNPEKFDVLIVLGIGLGYHLAPLSENLRGYSRIILIDILAGIDSAIRTNPVTSFLLKSERITLIAGKPLEKIKEILSQMIDMDEAKGISVIEHPASMRIFEDYYGAIKQYIEKQINKKAGNKATRKAFGNLYLRNIIKNIPILNETRPVRELFGALRSFPAIIVAPGPCLEKDLMRIQEHQRRFFIVSVDSALRVLNGHGIVPDFIVSIDPQAYVYEHLLDACAGTAIGVSSISSHPLVINRLKGYISLNSHPLSQVAARVYGDSIGSIDSGTGSVAGDAVNLCLKCGFGAIGIAGLDFSFTDYKIYSRGTAYQRRYSTYFQNRVSTVEGYNCRYILVSSKGLKHGGKFTRKSFMRYKESLEDFIHESGAGGMCALNDCGMPISGLPVVGLDEFVAGKCKYEIDKRNVLASIQQDSRRLDPGPFVSALNGIIHDRLFDELLAASLGNDADVITGEKYKKLIDLLKQTLPKNKFH